MNVYYLALFLFLLSGCNLLSISGNGNGSLSNSKVSTDGAQASDAVSNPGGPNNSSPGNSDPTDPGNGDPGNSPIYQGPDGKCYQQFHELPVPCPTQTPVVATPEPTQTPVVATPPPTQQPVVTPSSPAPTQTPVVVATPTSTPTHSPVATATPTPSPTPITPGQSKTIQIQGVCKNWAGQLDPSYTTRLGSILADPSNPASAAINPKAILALHQPTTGGAFLQTVSLANTMTKTGGGTWSLTFTLPQSPVWAFACLSSDGKDCQASDPTLYALEVSDRAPAAWVGTSPLYLANGWNDNTSILMHAMMNADISNSNQSVCAWEDDPLVIALPGVASDGSYVTNRIKFTPDQFPFEFYEGQMFFMSWIRGPQNYFLVDKTRVNGKVTGAALLGQAYVLSSGQLASTGADALKEMAGGAKIIRAGTPAYENLVLWSGEDPQAPRFRSLSDAGILTLSTEFISKTIGEDYGDFIVGKARFTLQAKEAVGIYKGWYSDVLLSAKPDDGSP